LARLDLLIVDEVGFVPFTPEGARLLFQAFSERYLKRSLLITSNWSLVGGWRYSVMSG
jgi:DNA replication protein DnaC